MRLRFPDYPSRFNRFVVIEDVDEYHKPLFEMLSTSKTSVNLKDYMDDDLYHMQWRWRIDELDVLLLDQNGNVIQTNGQDFSDAISIGVTFPSLFNDTDPNKEGQTFLGHEFYCRSTYEAFGNLGIFWLSAQNFLQSTFLLQNQMIQASLKLVESMRSFLPVLPKRLQMVNSHSSF